MPATDESDLERAVIDLLKGNGCAYIHGEALDPEASEERENFHGVMLSQRLLKAVAEINPNAPADAVTQAANKILSLEYTDLLEENRRIHRLLVDGVPVEYQQDGETVHDRLKLVDWTNEKNDWLVVNQFTVVGNSRRRPDVLVFLNGMPLVVMELKAAETANADIESAFNQVRTYQSEIPELFRSNLINVISDGLTARYGTITAGLDRHMNWRTVDGERLIPPTSGLAVETLILGLLNPTALLNILRYFTVFENDGSSVTKKVAGYHQYHAAMKGLDCVKRAVATDGKAGVVWHTQGSGKSLLMTFFGGMLIHEVSLENPTLLVLTDRNDLDNQLFNTFSRCAELLGQTPDQAESVDGLRRLLDRQVGGVIFATIQKFRPEDDGNFQEITSRRNVIVFVDEAHRSQYGFGARINTETGERKFGFAYYLREGLPNATFVGFTGTPVEMVDKNTTTVFGGYIDVYDIARAVEDKATVPIHYEGKIVKLELDDDTRDAIDAAFDDATEEMEEGERAKVAQKWSKLEALAGSKQRLDELANLIVEHFDARTGAISGKGMIVCMSRRVCVELYERLVALRPSWHAADDGSGFLKVVMTGSASDPQEFQPHVRNKAKLDQLANRFRNANDDFRLVIVRDMWLTGFDPPSLHTLYVDKPMRGHNLMQAIARVNRIFKDKPAGLVVDTIGIATDLKEALQFYSDKDRELTGVDMEKALEALEEALEVLRSMFHGFDYSKAIDCQTTDRLTLLVAAVEFVYGLEGAGEENRKQSRKRFLDAVAALEKAFKLTSGTKEAKSAAEEVAFFAAIRVAMRKLEDDGGERSKQKNLDKAIELLVDQAVASTEVVDLLSAAGIAKPDLSVLSDEFLKEIEGVKQKNLAVEALKRLLNGEVKSRTRTNVVRKKEFTERIEQAMAKYHNRVVDALQVIEELIRIAKSLREEPEDGLTKEEEALYDALADNDSAIEVIGNEKLRIIASELVISIRDNASHDWWKFPQRRARIRVAVKRILKKYGYPPDLAETAIKTVVLQAEALAPELMKAA